MLLPSSADSTLFSCAVSCERACDCGEAVMKAPNCPANSGARPFTTSWGCSMPFLIAPRNACSARMERRGHIQHP